MSLKEKAKKIWRSSGVLRRAFWWCYERRPSALYLKARTDYRLDHALPRLYTSECAKPVDERMVLFVEPRYPDLPSGMKLLYDLVDSDDRFDAVFFSLDSMHAKTEELFDAWKKLTQLAAGAAYIFTDDACEVLGCLPLRPETVYVQLWHACGAFKGFGMSTAGLTFGTTRKQMLRHSGYANTDIVTVSSPEVIWAYAEAMSLPEDHIYATGISRTDVFFAREVRQEAYEKLWEAFPASKGKKVILYAPTFRGHSKSATTALAFKPEVLCKSLSDEYVLVIKHHPIVRSLPKLPPEIDGSFAADLSGSMNIEDLMMTADICITDYSSIVFEYSLLLRPMLFFAYDLEDYSDWRGFYYPYEEMTPGPVLRTNEELARWIADSSGRFDKKQMEAFRDRFMASCDGSATERILALAGKIREQKISRARSEGSKEKNLKRKTR